jgi:hypothetical protein
MKLLVTSLLYLLLNPIPSDHLESKELGILNLKDGSRINLYLDRIELTKTNSDILDSKVMEGELIHWFHLNEITFNIQTSLHSYILKVEAERINIVSKTKNPNDFKDADSHFYLKWDEKELIITEKGGAVSMEYNFNNSGQPKRYNSFNRPTNKNRNKTTNQVIYDYRNHTAYFNLKNQFSSVYLNMETGFMGNILIPENSNSDSVNSWLWYLDAKTNFVYLLVNPTKGRGKLFDFQNGLPKQPNGKKTGRTITYNSFNNCEELGIYIGLVNQIPVYVYNQTLVFNDKSRMSINDL